MPVTSTGWGHTTIECEAPFGSIRIIIMRGGLPGGDSGIAVNGTASWRGRKWDVHMCVISRYPAEDENTIPGDTWREWPAIYGCHPGDDSSQSPDDWPPDGWAEDIAAQMRTVYETVMDSTVIARARRYALETYVPGIGEEIERTRAQLDRLIVRARTWKAELENASGDAPQ